MTAGSAQAPTLLDPSRFTQQRPLGNGSWNVAADNLSVTQTINGEPTAFVSADSFINSSFQGSSRTTDTDDDYMGFVFGFGADESEPFLLLTWKQGRQDGSQPDFTLSRVTGGFNAIPFGDPRTDAVGYDVLATNTGLKADLGYQRNSTCDFELEYLSNRAVVTITTAAGSDPADARFASGVTVFDVTAASVGLPGFGAGRFGFCKHSQDNATYRGFTQEDLPPPPPSGDVPLPPAMALMALAFGGLGWAARRRRAA